MNRLGYNLLQQHKISSEQLSEATSIQQVCGGGLGQIIIDLGFATENQIAATLAIEHKIPYLALDRYELSPQAVLMIDESVAREHCLIAVECFGDSLSVAIADPAQVYTLEAIAQSSGCHIHPFVSAASEIREAIDRHYKKPLLKSDDLIEPVCVNERPADDVQAIEDYRPHRRVESRVDCRLPLMLVMEEPQLHVISIETENLSMQGLLCRMQEPLIIGTELTVWIAVPGENRMRTQGEGCVVRTNPVNPNGPTNGYDVGIAMRNLCNHSETVLKRYLQQN